jgi:3',5'-cyclic AMP phosphodiesterase CpdA
MSVLATRHPPGRIAMPVYLLPSHSHGLTRRAFLSGVVAGSAAISLRFPGAARADGATPWLAWLADTHIAADPAARNRDQVMAENLKAAVADVLAQADRPVGAFIDGDLALSDGQSGDYKTLLDLLAPLREARVPIHMTLGNHDDRAHFREALHAEAPPDKAIADKHVGLIDLGGIRLVLLDSLQRPNYTPGKLGPDQLAWPGRTLEDAPSRPVVLFVHHNLADDPNALTDTAELLALVRPRKQVKAIVYGHSHRWEHAEREGLHLLNLPAVAYPFADDQPLGWVRVEVRPSGLDRRFPRPG